MLLFWLKYTKESNRNSEECLETQDRERLTQENIRRYSRSIGFENRTLFQVIDLFFFAITLLDSGRLCNIGHLNDSIIVLLVTWDLNDPTFCHLRYTIVVVLS
mmetsp:Transcript_46999/g.54181  ORF Transcript_46999/g.54181 Transcript_46999/m.54181 type:complete len:103 (+) Transcript_46999:15-323(+)